MIESKDKAGRSDQNLNDVFRIYWSEVYWCLKTFGVLNNDKEIYVVIFEFLRATLIIKIDADYNYGCGLGDMGNRVYRNTSFHTFIDWKKIAIVAE